MRPLELILFSLFLSFGIRAQFVQEIEGEYFGKKSPKPTLTSSLQMTPTSIGSTLTTKTAR